MAIASPLADTERIALRILIDEIGLIEAARRLNIPRHTLAAAASGGRLREGTRMLIADRFLGTAGTTPSLKASSRR